MIVNLRESLNTRDRKSVNGNSKYYDLVNLYDTCNLSADNKKTLAKMINNNASDKAIYSFLYECYEGKEDIKEDTVKKDGKWVNKGKEGTHGEFKTKKAADAQRKAMFANGYKGESLKESTSIKEEPHEECIGNNCADENDLFPEEKYFTIVVTRSDDGEDEIIDDVTKEIADKYIDDLKRDNDEFFSHAKVLDHNGEVVNSWEYLEEAAKSKKSSSIKDRLKKLIPDLDI